jgi:hypothetical protein
MPHQEVIQVVQVDQLAVKVNLEDLALDMALEPFKLDNPSQSLVSTQAPPTIKTKISILVNKILYKTFNQDSPELAPHQLLTT